MKKKLPKLYVQMFGKFILTYEDRVISSGRSNVSKATQLLVLLLYAGDAGVSRDELLQHLYGETVSDRSLRNLYSCVHYLKDMLAETTLPEYDYIVLKKGVYRWNAPMETVIDAKSFIRMTKGAKVESLEDVERLKEACNIYRRGFLPDFSDQEWVLLEGIRLKRYYTEAVEQICAWLMQAGELEEAYRMAEQACNIYPYDDWQVIKMQCLIAMGRSKEAVAEYYETQELLRKEMDVDPPEKMRELLRQAKRSKDDRVVHRFVEAIGQLKEGDGDADIVYYCDLPGFRDTYRMIARRIEYNGKSASLMLLSFDNETDLKKKMKLLKQAIWQSLRRTDVFTQCSATQYLILLYGVGAKDGKNIAGRIRARFMKTWQGADELTISVAPVEPANDSPEPQEYRRIDDIK